jgi:hypothetical protein
LLGAGFANGLYVDELASLVGRGGALDLTRFGCAVLSSRQVLFGQARSFVLWGPPQLPGHYLFFLLGFFLPMGFWAFLVPLWYGINLPPL